MVQRSGRPAPGYTQVTSTPRVEEKRWGVVVSTDRLREVLPQLWEYGALLVVLLAATVFTASNMFRYPQYELDEGTYVGAAWAMFKEGKLFYYTYTYAHPPFGWFVLGLWATLTGGFHAFGASVNTGRALMLLVTLLSTLLIFAIIRRATGRVSAAALGALAFAVSPLGVSLHRQVYLDNLATFWFLVSLYLLVTANGSLWRTVLSGLAFGLAFWSKEVIVVLLPGMALAALVQSSPANRRYATTLWSATAVAVISLFPLMALLKDELLPPGVLWSSPQPHVSLIGTYLRQAARPGGGLLDPDGDFWQEFAEWRRRDPALILGGLGASGIGLLAWRRDRLLFCVSLLVVSFVLFLGRGGVVFFYYIIPLLALLALALGLLAGCVINAPVRWPVLSRAGAAGVLALSLVLMHWAVPANRINFTANRTSDQQAATRWIARNLPPSSLIITDSFPWADLRDPSLVQDEPFTAHYYWPLLADPILRRQLLKDDWRTIDYLVTSPVTVRDITRNNLPLVSEALEESDPIKVFESSDWPITIWRVRKLHQFEAPAEPILVNTWESYKKRFIEDGRVIEPNAGRRTTSEGQAYAMLRAVYMGDRETFDRVWAWTKANLQQPSGVLAWLWGIRPDGAQGVLDSNSATDADEDAALALLFASRRWNEPSYQQEALVILHGIWEQDTAVVNGRRVVTAGSWARMVAPDGRRYAVMNPSYFAPYAYRIFADADPSRPWMDLVHSTYDLLRQLQRTPGLGGEVGLVPDWFMADIETGSLHPVNVEGLNPNLFSHDASRVPLRIAIDWLWFQDNRAKEILSRLSLPKREIGQSGKLMAAYHLDGSPAASYESTSVYAGILPGLLLSEDRWLAHRVFAQKILGAYVDAPGQSYWGQDPEDYYTQNMAWFATALMNGALSNLWAGERVIDWARAMPEG